MNAKTSAAVGGLVVALALALTGCAPALTSSSTAGRTPGAVRSSTPTPVPSGIACDSLASPQDVQALLGGSAPLRSTPADALVGAAGRSSSAITNAGGTVCEWGTSPDALHGGALSFFASVRVLPHATAAWNRLADAYGSAATEGAAYDGGVSRGGDCFAEAGSTECKTNVLVGSSWLAVSALAPVRDAFTESAFHAWVQKLLPVVMDAEPRAAPARTATRLHCGDNAHAGALASAFGIPAASSMGIEETFRIDAAALLYTDETVCQYQPSDDGSGGYLGALTVLPDAEKTFAAYRAAALSQPSPATPITLTHEGAPLDALSRTEVGATPADTFTFVDALVDGDWLQFVARATDAAKPAAYLQWVIDHR